MNVQTLQYSASAGVSAPIGPELDSERTLVLVFASPEFDALPFGSHQVGFYSYGELCPQNGASCCELHNQTMTITTISERN